VRRFFAANPFYLASVLLLLYGIHRVSADGGLFRTEVHQLFFNFSALQAYELALVVLAVFLARRRVWYDSTLLALLENLVLIVPFILVTQASLINQGWIGGFCAVGVGLAVTRLGVLKRGLPGLSLPWPLLAMGGLLLGVNAAWPVIYRELQEERMARTITSGPAYLANEWSWLALLPLLVAGASLLPAPRANGAGWPQRRWLTPAILMMWLVASGVHLYALSYVYTFAMRPAHWAPVVVMLVWTAFYRLPDWLGSLPQGLRLGLMLNPFVWMFLALRPGDHGVLLGLAFLNAALYGLAAMRHQQPALAVQLALASGIAGLAVLPRVAGWETLALEFARIGWAGALAVYVIFASILSRRPAIGCLGVLAAAILTALVVDGVPQEGCAMLHAALMFLLLHGLRWDAAPHTWRWNLRWAVALGWITQSWVWAWTEGSAGVMGATGGVTFLMGLVVWWILRRRLSLAVPVAGVLVMLSGPVVDGFGAVRNAPAGLMAVVASFVLLALGTAAALTKNRWHPTANAAAGADGRG
jgi:hypothetical protein